MAQVKFGHLGWYRHLVQLMNYITLIRYHWRLFGNARWLQLCACAYFSALRTQNCKPRIQNSGKAGSSTIHVSSCISWSKYFSIFYNFADTFLSLQGRLWQPAVGSRWEWEICQGLDCRVWADIQRKIALINTLENYGLSSYEVNTSHVHSIHPSSFHPSIHRFIHPSIHPSIHPCILSMHPVTHSWTRLVFHSTGKPFAVEWKSIRFTRCKLKATWSDNFVKHKGTEVNSKISWFIFEACD